MNVSIVFYFVVCVLIGILGVTLWSLIKQKRIMDQHLKTLQEEQEELQNDLLTLLEVKAQADKDAREAKKTRANRERILVAPEEVFEWLVKYRPGFYESASKDTFVRAVNTYVHQGDVSNESLIAIYGYEGVSFELFESHLREATNEVVKSIKRRL